MLVVSAGDCHNNNKAAATTSSAAATPPFVSNSACKSQEITLLTNFYILKDLAFRRTLRIHHTHEQHGPNPMLVYMVVCRFEDRLCLIKFILYSTSYLNIFFLYPLPKLLKCCQIYSDKCIL
jgi:hypothetical protein